MTKRKSLLNKFLAPLRKLFKKKKKRKIVKKKTARKKGKKALSKSKKKRPPKKKVVKKTTLAKVKKAEKVKAKKKTPSKKKSSRKKTSASKKPVKKVRPISKKVVVPKGLIVGEITHFFSKIQVVVIRMDKGNLKVGDQIRIAGKSTDFVQKISSLQIESIDVKSVRKGQLAGLKAKKPARPGDKIIKLA